jgi:CRP-like cAMP-binding protein
MLTGMTWPVFSRLSDADREHLLSAAVTRKYRNREVVFHTGDSGDSMFLIRSGHVAVRTVTEYGDESTLVVLGAGDTFGELALLGADRKRAATVTAIAETTTSMLSRRALDNLRADRPDIDQLIIDLLARQIEILTGQLLESRYVPVRHRVARVLLRLYAQYQPGQAAGPVDLVITQDDVAGLVGATRPTVNQVLRTLESAGGIALRRGRIRVLDVETVRRHRG